MNGAFSRSSLGTRCAAAVLAALACTLLAALALGVGSAWADSIPELTGDTQVTPRSGVPIQVNVAIDQPTTREDAMRMLKEYRQEALDEGIVDLPDGMTPDEYVNGVKWNIDLERTAIQRAIEHATQAEILSLAHIRTNGTSWFTAESNGVSASTEICADVGIGEGSILFDANYLQWAASQIDMMRGFQLWHGEKFIYVDNRAKGTHGGSGHYEALIDPMYKSYGFARVAVEGCGWFAFCGHASTEEQDYDDESVGYSGAYDATILANDNEAFTVSLHAYCTTGGVMVDDSAQIRATAQASFLGTRSQPVDMSTVICKSLNPEERKRS